jgi:hypothetical protein
VVGQEESAQIKAPDLFLFAFLLLGLERTTHSFVDDFPRYSLKLGTVQFYRERQWLTEIPIRSFAP